MDETVEELEELRLVQKDKEKMALVESIRHRKLEARFQKAVEENEKREAEDRLKLGGSKEMLLDCGALWKGCETNQKVIPIAMIRWQHKI